MSLSSAPAALHHHVLVVFKNYFLILVQVQQRYGTEFRRDAASSGNIGIDRVDQRLDDGVIGGVQVVRQWKGTLAVAVESMVARRRHDPLVPAHVAEVHIERVPPAVCALLLLPALLLPLPRLPLLSVRMQDGRALTVVAVGHQQGSGLRPWVLVCVKRATDSHVPPLVPLDHCGSFRLLGMEHLHQEPMVVLGFAGPASNCRTHVEALPARVRVLHQTGVEKSGKRLFGSGQCWPEHLVNVNSVETTRTGVTENLVPENAQLCGRDQLLSGNGGKVE